MKIIHHLEESIDHQNQETGSENAKYVVRLL